MAEQGNRELLEAVGRHLQQMSGVNLATAFHRLARAKDSTGSKEIIDRTLQAMMDRAELLAGQDMMYQDGSMPPNCCTLIAWSCATLGTFRNSLFSMLTTNTLRSLPHCQIYELTNLLWSYAQLNKLSKVGQLLPNLRDLTDAVMKLFLDAGVKNMKVQVLISALVSVASLPGGASASWLFAEISEELAQRWDELPIRKRSQVVLAFQLMRNQNRDLVQKTVKSVARRCPDMSSALLVAMELLGPVPEIVLWYLLTMVFDAVLRQQPYKLSATGQELGSSMLFSSRIGFSGTPSSLLPEELGECLFEAENEGEILSVLSDEQHVVPPLIEMPADWSPESILITVAKSKDPVYHCLIDTGALVMGFTNEEVAKLLLKMLSEELFDGVAYFDDHALLSEAGVPMERRFTFFDQARRRGRRRWFNVQGKVLIQPETGVLKAHRLEAARCLLRFFNCDLDFRPEEVTSTVKAIEAGGSKPRQRQHFVESLGAKFHRSSSIKMRTVLGARRREACSWHNTPLGEVVRGNSAQLEERAVLATNLYGLMHEHFKSSGDFFKVLDVNGDGVIQHEEFQRSMKKIFKGAFSSEECRKLFTAADSRGQGNVTSEDIYQLLRLGAIATGKELPEAPGAYPSASEDPGSPAGGGSRPGTASSSRPGTAGSANPSSPSPNPEVEGPPAVTSDDLWSVSREAARGMVDRLTQELVRVMPERRQKIFRELAGAREKKEKDTFLTKLGELAGRWAWRSSLRRGAACWRWWMLADPPPAMRWTCFSSQFWPTSLRTRCWPQNCRRLVLRSQR
ncbi:unnamed protein product [Effrenium voratum]|nr:unnamed protein product [Effrenium voratum]